MTDPGAGLAGARGRAVGVRIAGVRRAFGDVRAVRDVSLDIDKGELFTLLGPSGCGKTTLLRMVAGFCELDGGAIHFGARRVDALPPHRRNAGMVFQNYAIFPNHTVAGNVAYGLRVRGVSPGETHERVHQLLRMVHLDGFEDRWPHQLSGGQLQRVALARCLVIEPDVLLLDEPLSNLDAQLRVQMRAEIRQLQRALGITTLYVTHDQEEALAISDRIGVMRAGRLEQVGPGWEVYRTPATPFVAEFMGATNLLRGEAVGPAPEGTRVRVGAQEVVVPGRVEPPGRAVAFSLRPEALRIVEPGAPPPPGWSGLDARLGRVEFLGALTRLDLVLAGDVVLRAAVLDLSPDRLPPPGRMVRVAYEPGRVAVFADAAAAG